MPPYQISKKKNVSNHKNKTYAEFEMKIIQKRGEIVTPALPSPPENPKWKKTRRRRPSWSKVFERRAILARKKGMDGGVGKRDGA